MIESTNVFFLDIETVPYIEKWKDVPPPVQNLFRKKFKAKFDTPVSLLGYADKLPDPQVIWDENAGFFAEFNKIVCVCVGRIYMGEGNVLKLGIRALTGTEQEILDKLTVSLAKSDLHQICAHNGKRFDFPVLIRKYLMYRKEVPPQLLVGGKKPWDLPWIDTMEIWGAGEWKYTVSLDMLSYLFGLPSPKQEISGADVGPLFYAGALKDIISYCVLDVVTLVNAYRSMCRQEIFTTHTVA